MLRTTFSRIKRVCTLAFTPRLLRADQRCGGAKFELLSYVGLRKAQKSTKPTDHEPFENKKEKHKHIRGVIVLPESEPKLQSDKYKSDLENNLHHGNFKGNVYTSTKPLKETHCEKCQRLIDQAFGKEDVDSIGHHYYSQGINIKHTRRENRAFGKEDIDSMGHQYYSQGVDIEETRREINRAELERLQLEQEMRMDIPIPDNRIRFGAFRRELIDEDATLEQDELQLKPDEKKDPRAKPDIADEALEETSLVTPRPLSVYITANYEGKISEQHEAKTGNMTEIETELEVNNQHEQSDIQKSNLELSRLWSATADKDGADTNVQNENRDSTIVDANIDKTYVSTVTKCMPDTNVKENLDVTMSPTSTAIKHSENELNHIRAYLDKHNLDLPDAIVRATTAKENEEELTQRIEHIDETPLVEAQRQAIEGFNVTPRVLGAIDNTVNCICDKGGGKSKADGPYGLDVPGKFDEVAKRCLDSPPNKIDEILLKEMEKLGLPVTTHGPSDSHVIENELVQMDVLKKHPRKPIDKDDLDLESREYGAATLYTITNKDNSNWRRDEEEELDTSELGTQIHPHQVLIDPYDKKTLAYITDEYDPYEKCPPYEYSYFYVQRPKLADEADVMDVKPLYPIEKTNILEKVGKKQSYLKVVQRRTRLSDSPMRKRQREYIQKVKKQHPLARKIDEAYLQCKNIGCKATDSTMREEQMHCDQADKEATKVFTKNAITHPFSTSKIVETEETSEQKSESTPAENEENNPQESTPSYDQYKMHGYNNIWQQQYYNQPQIQQQQQTYSQGMVNYPQFAQQPYTQATVDKSQFAQYTYTQTMVGKPPFAQPTYTQGMVNKPSFAQPSYTQGTVNKPPLAQPPPHLCVSNSSWFPTHKFAHKEQHVKTHQVNTSQAKLKESSNKTNVCESDGTWDAEPVSCEQPQKKVEKNDAKDDAVPPMPMEEVNEMKTNTTKKARTFYGMYRTKKPVMDNLWNQNQLDPKHVLTCNETCPISPRPIVNEAEKSLSVDTEAIFKSDFIKTASSLRVDREPMTECESGTSNNPETSADDSVQNTRLSNFMPADSILNPAVNDQKSPSAASVAAVANTNTAAVNSVSNVTKEVPLSELLKRVRMHSRNAQYKSTKINSLGVEVDPAQGKTGNKPPTFQPLAPKSPQNKIPPPPFGLPKVKARPRPCPRKRPKAKCSSCDMDMLSGLQLGLKAYERNAVADIFRTKSLADLSDEVIDRLHTLGKFLGSVLHQGKTVDLEPCADAANRRGSKILFARDFEPWSPIPSWPNEKKERCQDQPKKKDCSPGCKVFPPTRATHDPPCDPRPATGFPRRSFSLSDCFAYSLGDHMVYDLGEF